MKLTFEEGRVLGAMIEKAATTPANYPMSLNGVMIACNQVSNRDPVVEFSEAQIELLLRGLADRGLAKMVHRPGDRVVKYRQALDDQLQLNPQEASLLAVLLLRGAQTPGELNQRTARYVEFSGLEDVEGALGELGRRGLAERLERQPGQKESRYRETVSGEARAPGNEPAGDAPPPVLDTEVASDMRSEVNELRRRFEELLDRLGEEIP